MDETAGGTAYAPAGELEGTAYDHALAALIERAERADDTELRLQAAVVRRTVPAHRQPPRRVSDAPAQLSFVDLRAVVRSVLDRLPWPERVHVETNLPDEAAPIHVAAGRLEQALFALVTGLVDTTPQCVLTLDVELSADPGQPAVVVLGLHSPGRRLSMAELARHVGALALTNPQHHGSVVGRRVGATWSFTGLGLAARVGHDGTTVRVSWPVDLG